MLSPYDSRRGRVSTRPALPRMPSTGAQRQLRTSLPQLPTLPRMKTDMARRASASGPNRPNLFRTASNPYRQTPRR